LRSHGLAIDAARASSLLGRTLLAQGRAAEAEALSHESEALAGDDLLAAITWRRVRAEALTGRGDHAGAAAFARAAVDIASATDALIHHAEARLALAAALRAAGRADEADAEEKRAIELWDAKGATVLAERARLGRVDQAKRALDDPAAPARPVRRRAAANGATAFAARTEAVIAARDADALPGLFADGQVTVHHPTGIVYDGEAGLASWRSLIRAEDQTLTLEPLATLGESLALCRNSISASRIGRGKFDVGPFERDEFVVLEVDARGQNRRAEIFAADRLADAVVSLYERYAELLPDGPERTRALAEGRVRGA
jgi:tetratricopeptide (TPR) repeat protein